MTIILSEITTKETKKLVPILLDADEDEERIRTTLADEKNTSYAALKGDELVGAVTVKWEEQESEILYIAVIQKLRGRGYGKSIIEILIDEMLCRGVHSLLVGTSNSSIDNIAFYQKCGFRIYQVQQDFFDYIQPPIRENGIMMRDMLVLQYKA
jgi:ribosomal protein S18 acetylase RimI-like enzyme